MKVTAIDFETANNSPASVCSVGLSVLEDGCAEEAFYSLIRPEPNVSRFLPFNIKIHGIRPEDTADAPEFAEVLRKMMPYFEDSIICAHNAPFDMSCLRAACLNCGIPVPHIRYFDTVALSRRMFPALEHHRLNDMCSYLNIELNHHNAASDAYGCLMIVVQTMNLTGIYEIEDLLDALNIRIKNH
ncbi:MAG: 3'-5' exonuclease [Solobacterium sp.]|nr:3'-5' exonuclease [Solobacterium sp.]